MNRTEGDGSDRPPAESTSGGPVRIVLNRAFEEDVGPEGVRAYVEALVTTGHDISGRSADELGEVLRQKLEIAGVPAPPLSYRTSAEQLIQSGGQLVIVSADGVVLHGADNRLEAQEAAGGEGTSDPENPNRPFYS
jgi:hypothetical protein